MATIKLYGAFRRHVDKGAWQVEIAAPTVGEALRILTADNPALREAIFAPAGGDAAANCTALRLHVRVIVNGRDTALGDCLDTPVKAGDDVGVFSPIAGG
ncbi:MAG: MoaD/ThiS family protein [Anaerolineae bacterium]|nr:MoaD/ThiS family protein [Anaerolineae bacterium]